MLYHLAIKQIHIQLEREAGFGEYTCNETTAQIIITPAIIGKTIFTFRDMSPDLSVKYASPPASTPIDMKPLEKPALYIPDGNAEISIVMKSGEYIKYAWLGFNSVSCTDKVLVSTQGFFSKTLYANEVLDFCIFHAPVDPHIVYQITDTNLPSEGSLQIFDDSDFDLPLDSYSLDYQTYWSTISDKPLLYRLRSYVKYTPESDLLVTLESKSIQNITSINFFDEPILVEPTTFGFFRNSWTLPSIGIAIPSILLVSWIIGVFLLLRKRPNTATIPSPDV